MPEIHLEHYGLGESAANWPKCKLRFLRGRLQLAFPNWIRHSPWTAGLHTQNFINTELTLGPLIRPEKHACKKYGAAIVSYLSQSNCITQRPVALNTFSGCYRFCGIHKELCKIGVGCCLDKVDRLKPHCILLVLLFFLLGVQDFCICSPSSCC